MRRHGDKAYNFAYRLAGDEENARELVQAALVKAFEHRARYDSARPFDSWLMKIMQNIYLDGVRRYERTHAVSLDALVPSGESTWEERLAGPGGDPAEDAVRAETDALLQEALDALPVHYRTAVVLSDIEGLPYEKIGEIMACPIGTVRSRIHQGRVLMRRRFEELQKGVRHGKA